MYQGFSDYDLFQIAQMIEVLISSDFLQTIKLIKHCLSLGQEQTPSSLNPKPLLHSLITNESNHCFIFRTKSSQTLIGQTLSLVFTLKLSTIVIVIVNSVFLQRTQKRSRGNQLIHRRLFKTKSIGSRSDPESQASAE